MELSEIYNAETQKDAMETCYGEAPLVYTDAYVEWLESYIIELQKGIQYIIEKKDAV